MIAIFDPVSRGARGKSVNVNFHRAGAYVLCVLALLGCGDSEGTSITAGAGSGGADAGADVTAALYALHVKVALTAGAQGVDLIVPNGSTVHVPPEDIIGKTAYWATSPGGEPVSGAGPIEFGSVIMGDDLTTDLSTSATYESGPWEMSLFISITEGPIVSGPQPGDLAAFDNSPPPAGEPPVTGSSVRMRIQGADASVTLNNIHFIQF